MTTRQQTPGTGNHPRQEANAFVPEINTSNKQVPQNSGTSIDSPPQRAAVQAKNDPEGSMQDLRTFYFSETSIKHGFIRKVYAILTLQLLIIVGLSALVLHHDATIDWINDHEFAFTFVIVSAFVTNLIILLLMGVHPPWRRQSPTNYIFLILFTVSKGILLAFLSVVFKTDLIWMAAGITAVVCFAGIIFAFQTKWEFNLLSAPIFVAASILLVFGIVGFVNLVDIINLCYAALGAFIFSLSLVFSTHLTISGRHDFTISPEEYIFTALSLYIDIVFFFFDIRRIIAAFKK